MHYPGKTRLELLHTPGSRIKGMLESITRKNFENLYGSMVIQREIMSFKLGFSKGDKELPAFMDMFPVWANPEKLELKPAYPKALVGSFSHALKEGMVSNRLLAKLDTKKLRASGWNPKEKY